MPVFETQEQVDKAVAAMKAYRLAKNAAAKAADVVKEKLTALKNVIGVSTNDPLQVEEEIRRLIGDTVIDGLPENHGR